MTKKRAKKFLHKYPVGYTLENLRNFGSKVELRQQGEGEI
jgi:hypothetical protein